MPLGAVVVGSPIPRPAPPSRMDGVMHAVVVGSPVPRPTSRPVPLPRPALPRTTHLETGSGPPPPVTGL